MGGGEQQTGHLPKVVSGRKTEESWQVNTFPKFLARDERTLDGAWDFHWQGDAGQVEDIDPSRVSFDTVMAVPGVFDALPRYAGERGIGVYRSVVLMATTAGERLRLVCHGMGLYGRLWWDGRAIGDYDLPYSGVEYDFTTTAGERHELVIALDSRFNQEKVPIVRPFYDFCAYGGIYRSLALQRLPALRLERVQVTTLDLATGRVRLRLCLGGDIPGEVAGAVAFDAGPAQAFRLTPAGNAGILELAVPGFRVWSPATPHLHTVTVSLAGGDAISERFGLRTIEAVGQELRLNGQPLRLLGVNRHEAHPQYGPALPVQTMVEDLQHLKDLGANFVRCVHYPHDQQFLDLCDQAGLLVWQESLGWGNDARDVVSPRFAEAQVRQTRAMVRHRINHPSVILWGFLNEFVSDSEAARPLCRSLVETIRQEDSSRLVTYASCRNERDVCFDLVDVISMNTYPGWIGDLDWNAHAVTRVAPGVKRLADFASRPPLAGKPFIMSEIGACGLYGSHSLARVQWTEEFQADYMAEAARAVLGNPRFCGLALWQMVDSRSYGPWGQVRTKPNGTNLAGLLDEYRRRKLAFDAVRAVFQEHRKP